MSSNINYRKLDEDELNILIATAHEVAEGRDQFSGYDLFLLEYFLNELRNEWQRQKS